MVFPFQGNSEANKEKETCWVALWCIRQKRRTMAFTVLYHSKRRLPGNRLSDFLPNTEDTSRDERSQAGMFCVAHRLASKLEQFDKKPTRAETNTNLNVLWTNPPHTFRFVLHKTGIVRTENGATLTTDHNEGNISSHFFIVWFCLAKMCETPCGLQYWSPKAWFFLVRK